MGTFITLGKYNNQYKYLLYYFIFEMINNFTYGLNYYGQFNQIKVIFFDNQKLRPYSFIRQRIVGYFGTFVLPCISMVYDKIKNNSEQKDVLKLEKGNTIVLVHEHDKQNEENKISLFFIIVIIFGWVFEEQALEKYSNKLCHLDIWMLELIVMAQLNSKILNIPIYRHHKFVIIFSIIPIIFKIITIFLECYDDKSKCLYDENLYWIPIGLLIYLPLVILKAYVIVKIKWFMDLKYIYANKLLIIYGLIGTVFYSIFSIISSFERNTKRHDLFIDINYSFYSYFCFLKDSGFWQIIAEIIIYILGMITSYYIKYNFMMIIEYLNPMHIIFLSPIFFFFSKVFLLIYNLIYCSIYDYSKFFGNKSISFRYAKFSLDFSQDIFSFIGFLIYLEIIELNCFGLNYNLRDKIIKRANNEFYKIEDCKSTSDESSNEDLTNSINSDNSLDNIINITHTSEYSL